MNLLKVSICQNRLMTLQLKTIIEISILKSQKTFFFNTSPQAEAWMFIWRSVPVFITFTRKHLEFPRLEKGQWTAPAFHRLTFNRLFYTCPSEAAAWSFSVVGNCTGIFDEYPWQYQSQLCLTLYSSPKKADPAHLRFGKTAIFFKRTILFP